MSKSFWLYSERVLAHYALAVLGGMLLGFIPELLLGRLWRFTPFEPFFPGMSVTALLLGYFVSKRLWEARGATWTWVAGSVWFIYGIHDLTRFWSARWSHDKSAWDYAMKQLFGPNQVCGTTECLYQFFYTLPLAASVLYSVGSFLRKRVEGRKSDLPGRKILNMD